MYHACKSVAAPVISSAAAWIGAVVTLIPMEAHAIGRYTSTSMTCANIHEAIDREGAVILRYSPRWAEAGVTLYDRYVRDAAQCSVGTEPRRLSVPARDGQCPVLFCRQSWGHNNR
jgi:hypothetical protein